MKPSRVLISTFPLLGVAALAASAWAVPQPPDPAPWTIQGAYIAVAGSTNGQTDGCSDGRCGNFTVTGRDTANNVIAGAEVIVDFSGCPDIQISCDQLTASTGQVYLGGKRVRGYTNALGQFTFKVIGSAMATLVPGAETAPGTNVGVPCAQVYGDGVPLTPALIVAAYDINGLGSPASAVNGADASLVAAEVTKVPLGGQPRARDDYNGSNTVNGADAGIMARMVLQAALGTGSQSTGPFCP